MNVNEVIGRYDTDAEVRLFLVFEGTVQGVGFRWTTQELANESGVTGWVENMPDGTVEAELQGTGRAVASVLGGIRNQFEDARRRYPMLRHLHFSVARCEKRAPRDIPAGTRFEVRG